MGAEDWLDRDLVVGSAASRRSVAEYEDRRRRRRRARRLRLVLVSAALVVAGSIAVGLFVNWAFVSPDVRGVVALVIGMLGGRLLAMWAWSQWDEP